MASHLILVSRPGHAGEELADLLNSLGCRSAHVPTLSIRGLPLETAENIYDLIIFISPNAVLYSLGRRADFITNNPDIYAVGSGTADQLKARGVERVIVPEQYNSEGLLELPGLQQVAEKKVLIVKGKGGRTLLAETLIERGARCELLDVYERHQCDVDETIWNDIVDTRYWLTCASIETLDSFELQRQQRAAPQPEKIFVASNRIAEHASGLGYTGIVLTAGAPNASFIESIQKQLAA